MKILDICLSLSDPVILSGIIVIFIRRHLISRFPCFFAYVVYGPIASVLRMSVRYKPHPYFWMYWSTDFVFDVLALLTLREVFRLVFPPDRPTFRRLRWLLPFTMLLLIGASLYQTFYSDVGGGSTRVVLGIHWLNIGVHGVEGIFLPVVIVLILVFAVPWPRYEIGILCGFGVSAYSIMFFSLLRFYGGSRFAIYYQYGPGLGFVTAMLIWLWVFLYPPEPEKPLILPAEMESQDQPQSTVM